jgi:hypothetical protein
MMDSFGLFRYTRRRNIVSAERGGTCLAGRLGPLQDHSMEVTRDRPA